MKSYFPSSRIDNRRRMTPRTVFLVCCMMRSSSSFMIHPRTTTTSISIKRIASNNIDRRIVPSYNILQNKNKKNLMELLVSYNDSGNYNNNNYSNSRGGNHRDSNGGEVFDVTPGSQIDIRRMDIIGMEYSNIHPMDDVVQCIKPGRIDTTSRNNNDITVSEKAQVVISMGPDPEEMYSNSNTNNRMKDELNEVDDYDLEANEYAVKAGTQYDKTRMYMIDMERSDQYEGGSVLRTLEPGIMDQSSGSTMNLANVVLSSGPKGDWRPDRRGSNQYSDGSGSSSGSGGGYGGGGDASDGRSSRGQVAFSSGTLGPPGGPGKPTEGYIYGPRMSQKRRSANGEEQFDPRSSHPYDIDPRQSQSPYNNDQHQSQSPYNDDPRQSRSPYNDDPRQSRSPYEESRQSRSPYDDPRQSSLRSHHADPRGSGGNIPYNEDQYYSNNDQNNKNNNDRYYDARAFEVENGNANNHHDLSTDYSNNNDADRNNSDRSYDNTQQQEQQGYYDDASQHPDQQLHGGNKYENKSGKFGDYYTDNMKNNGYYDETPLEAPAPRRQQQQQQQHPSNENNDRHYDRYPSSQDYNNDNSIRNGGRNENKHDNNQNDYNNNNADYYGVSSRSSSSTNYIDNGGRTSAGYVPFSSDSLGPAGRQSYDDNNYNSQPQNNDYYDDNGGGDPYNVPQSSSSSSSYFNQQQQQQQPQQQQQQYQQQQQQPQQQQQQQQQPHPDYNEHHKKLDNRVRSGYYKSLGFGFEVPNKKNQDNNNDNPTSPYQQ